MDKRPGQTKIQSGDGILHGVGKIALHLFGGRNPRECQMVWLLAQKTNMPHFREGSIICARPAMLDIWIEDGEQRGWPEYRSTFPLRHRIPRAFRPRVLPPDQRPRKTR